MIAVKLDLSKEHDKFISSGFLMKFSSFLSIVATGGSIQTGLQWMNLPVRQIIDRKRRRVDGA